MSPSVTAVEDTAEASTQDDVAQDRKESTAFAAQGVDLSDPDKYCKLCTASFNNPTMAAEHYSGRKHQRNLARQAPQSQLEEENEHGTVIDVLSLTPHVHPEVDFMSNRCNQVLKFRSAETERL